MSKTHKTNIDKFTHWPVSDGVRYSSKSIAHRKRNILNELGEIIVEYLGHIKDGFINDSFEVSQDYAYERVDDFINGFLNEECAFVPEVTDDLFLARIGDSDTVKE